jgi:predicted acetyltransferase
MKMTLRELRLSDEAAFEAAIAEWHREAEAEHDFAFHYGADESYADYLEKITAWSRGENLPGHFVPCSFLVGALDNGRLVGRVSIRHQLNDFLREIGGHVGYMVLPQFRRQGVGTELLRQAIPITRSLGLDRILVTCDEDNLGSRRIIELNGGIYEDSIHGPELAQPKRRYWIDIS